MSITHLNGNGTVETTLPSDHPVLPPPEPKAPAWQSQFPRYTHCVKFTDTHGHEHTCTIRDDSLVNILRDVQTLQTVIKVAREKAAKQSQPAPVDPAFCVEHSARCVQKGSVWLHKNGEQDGKAVWCKRKLAE